MRVSENKLLFYVCGRCDTKIWHGKDEEPQIPCPDCGYYHKDRDYHDIPSEIKVNFSDFS